MNKATRRAIVLMLGFALVAAACGDDDGTSTQATTADTTATAATEAPATTVAAETTTAAPTTTTTTSTTVVTTGSAVTTPEGLVPIEVIANHSIPLQPNTELVSVEEMNGGFRVGAVVNSPPPPGYAATLTDAGWDVLDVQFGSEATIAHLADGLLCLVAFANYDAATDPSYWFFFWVVTGLTPEDCVTASADIISFLSSLGRPS